MERGRRRSGKGKDADEKWEAGEGEETGAKRRKRRRGVEKGGGG